MKIWETKKNVIGNILLTPNPQSLSAARSFQGFRGELLQQAIDSSKAPKPTTSANQPMKKILLTLICVLALNFQTLHAAEVWVKWGASQSGSGTMADPKVVSTAVEFDNYMNSQAEGTTIHLLAGEFLTQGSAIVTTDGIRVKKGQKMRGAGIDSTVVKIANGGTGYLMAFNPTVEALQHGAEISDMTIDCNLQGQTDANAAGAALWGSDTRLSRIKVINWGSTLAYTNGPTECFVMRLGYDESYHGIPGQNNQFVTNCVIEEVVITRPAPVTHVGVTTAIMIHGAGIDDVGVYPGNGPSFANPSSGWVRGSVIRNCKVLSIHSGSAVGQPAGIQGFGLGFATENQKFHDNFAIDIGGPGSFVIYMEHAYFRNLAIENNFFVDVRYAYFFNSDLAATYTYMRENLSFRNNYFVLRNDESDGNAIGIHCPYLKVKNLVIANNYIIGGLGTPPANRNGLRIGDGALNLTVDNNVIDAAGTAGYDMWVTSGSTVASFRANNRQDGAEISYDGSPINGAAEVVFVPNQVGWYRLWHGCNYATARVLIDAGDINNRLTSLDFSFEMGGTAGLITLHRHMPYNGSAISKIRTSYDQLDCRFHYLDIHVQQANGITPIRVRFQDGGLHTKPFSTPTFLTSSPTPPAAVEERILDLGTGFRTSGALFSANTQITDDVSGKVLASAITGTLSTANGGLGADMSSLGVNRFPVTAGVGTFGSAAITTLGLDLVGSTTAEDARSYLGLVPSTSANFWRGDGTWAPVANTVRKLSDETITSDSTLSDDAVLKFTMAANTKYTIRLKVFFTTGATPDFKYRITGPSATLVRRQIIRAAGAATGTITPTFAIATTYSAADIPLDGTGTDGFVDEEIIVHNGATAGDFVFRWAQNVSSGTATTVRAGSYIEYMPF